MAEINKFSMYNLQFTGEARLKDKVDQMVDDITQIDDYNYVKCFVEDHFGSVEGSKWFDYPEYGKKIYVLDKDNKVEICMLKNDKQYYGKGWKKV